MQDKIDVKSALIRFLKQNDLSQKMAAKIIGVSESQFSHYIRGVVSPSVDTWNGIVERMRDHKTGKSFAP